MEINLFSDPQACRVELESAADIRTTYRDRFNERGN